MSEAARARDARCTGQVGEPPAPMPGSRKPGLHVLSRPDGSTSFVWWSQGKWVFWRGHERDDRRTPAEAAAHGWRYERPAAMAADGGAS